MGHPRLATAIERAGRTHLLEDGVEAVGEELLAHGFGGGALGEWADLYVEEIVLRGGANGDGVAAALEGGEEEIGVFLVGDGCDLDHEGSWSRGRCLDSRLRRGGRRRRGCGRGWRDARLATVLAA